MTTVIHLRSGIEDAAPLHQGPVRVAWRAEAALLRAVRVHVYVCARVCVCVHVVVRSHVSFAARMELCAKKCLLVAVFFFARRLQTKFGSALLQREAWWAPRVWGWAWVRGVRALTMACFA